MPEIRQRILENMQKFSRAMIGAVLFLPVIGLILALSSVLTNPTLIAETSFLHQLGQMLGDTFWPLFGNLGLLFCVGISYGLAKDKKTEVALVSVMCFIMFLGANHSWLEHTHGLAEKINGEYYGTGQTSCWALWWWIWAFSWALFSAARLRGCTIKSLPLSCLARCRCTAAPS